MNRNEQLQTIKKICASGRGILAADESTGTIGKRFSKINLENTLDNRTRYRDLLFNTPDLNHYISGVITFEETLLANKSSGERLIQPLLDNDIVVGIKVDKGVKPLYNTDGETVTQGLDDLDKRCQEYYKAGARFAKWRAVLKIGHNLPSELSIHENATTLARYASICQNNGLVPIVEPEILMDGNHSIDLSMNVTVNVLKCVYQELIRHNVDLECTLLKPNMVRPGVDCDDHNLDMIAELTIRSLEESVPKEVPGIVFLSGGMSETDATDVLNRINKQDTSCNWYLSFSYGRALQASVIQSWNGQDDNIERAQSTLLNRARLNGQATLGKYYGEDNSTNSLHENNYSY